MQIELVWSHKKLGRDGGLLYSTDPRDTVTYVANSISDLLTLCICLVNVDNHNPFVKGSEKLAYIQTHKRFYDLPLTNRYDFVATCQLLNIDLSNDEIISLMDQWFGAVDSELQPVAA